MSQNCFLVAGLGNPGGEYARTRHNIGFMAADLLAARASLHLKKQGRFNAHFARGRVSGHLTVLVKPQAYMNRSGFPLQQLSAYYKIPPSHIIVVHDDLDLPFGRIRISHNRGHGGHNGIRSIIEALGTRAFSRVRVGVGRPPQEMAGAVGHVLGTFSATEKTALDKVVAHAADACEAIMDHGVDGAMNRINTLR